jgi:hypothetical protein
VDLVLTIPVTDLAGPVAEVTVSVNDLGWECVRARGGRTVAADNALVEAVAAWWASGFTDNSEA